MFLDIFKLSQGRNRHFFFSIHGIVYNHANDVSSIAYSNRHCPFADMGLCK